MDTMTDTDQAVRTRNGRIVWMSLIVAASIGMSAYFACATPFAALATLAALHIDRRDALMVTGLVWLANQAVGYGLLGYPLNLSSLSWGLAIGVSAGFALLAASAFATSKQVSLKVTLPFVAAFAAFELGLYLAGFVLGGSEGAFTAAVVKQVFVINALALMGLLAAYNLAQSVGLLARDSATPSLAAVR